MHHASAVCSAAAATVGQKSSLDRRNLLVQRSNQSSRPLPRRTTPTLTSAPTAVNHHPFVYWASRVKNHSTWLLFFFFFQFKKETKILRIPPGWVSYFLSLWTQFIMLMQKEKKNHQLCWLQAKKENPECCTEQATHLTAEPPTKDPPLSWPLWENQTAPVIPPCLCSPWARAISLKRPLFAWFLPWSWNLFHCAMPFCLSYSNIAHATHHSLLTLCPS